MLSWVLYRLLATVAGFSYGRPACVASFRLSTLAVAALAAFFACGQPLVADTTEDPRDASSDATPADGATSDDAATDARPEGLSITIFGGGDWHAADQRYDVVTKSYRAVIHGDGKLGPWHEVSDFAGALAGAALMAPNHAVVVAAGGAVASQATSRDVMLAELSDAKWRPGFLLPEPRSFAAGAAAGGTLYLAGGVNGAGTFSRDVFAATYDDAGARVGSWAAASALPLELWGGAMVELGGRLYFVGGLSATSPPGAGPTWMSTPDAGALGPWLDAGAVPLGSDAYGAFHSVVVVEGKLVVVGALATSALATRDTFVGVPRADGTIEWRATDPLPFKTCLACAVVVRDVVYVLGGRDGDTHASVARGRVLASGRIDWTALDPLPGRRDAFGCVVR